MTTSPEQPQSNPDSWGPARDRVLTYHEPAATFAASVELSGLEYLTAMHEGRLPMSPIAQVCGMSAVSIEPGIVVYRCVADPSFYNPVGLIHGGLMCTLLDSATASAVHSTLPAGVTMSTIEIKVSYLRAVRAGDELTVEGRVTKPGRRVAFAEAEIRTTDAKLVATATSSIMVMAME